MTYRKFIWRDSPFPSFDGYEFKPMRKSYFYHSETFGLGNYRGNAFTTGSSPKIGSDFKHYSRSTEIFNMNNLTWSKKESIPHYPFATASEYVIVNVSNCGLL